ncbi:sugar ABC transporter substrate-binding protein [Azotobacter chroococcum]|uniref:substrate-binding domain-containing protein n=1 Tax=Azotobacter chroococcum TaxID=353 RepID=UPI0010397DCC|nr:substrate-binding domain-containing protein [Azotobacter chroococcum]TBW01391.1 sugar ABC transporter substrate-binding protein [Azotobacter chroococcum]
MKRRLFFRFLSAATLLCGLPLGLPAGAEPLQFALIAKRVDHPFFIQAGEGCAEAAQAQSDTCLLLGASELEHFRLQNQALEQALNMDLDGIALSVTHSKWLADHALQRAGKTPLITFEADLKPAERHLRRGYVGLDNLAFGQQLGVLAKRFRPQGGKLCVLNGSARETNYQERLQGIRQQLRGSQTQAKVRAADRLRGENGWSEPNRCPLYRAENPEKAVLQLAALLKASEVDVIISTGSWPIYQADVFRQQLGPLLAELDKKGARPAIIIATNEPDAAQRALLDDGLVQAYLSLEGREIGRQSYRMLKRLAQGEPVPEKIFVDSHIYLPKASTNIPSEP